MAIGHAFRESKLFKYIIAGFPLHGDGVRALDRIVLFSFFIESNFTDNTLSEFSQDFRDTLSYVVSGFFTEFRDVFGYLLSSILLDLGKLFDGLSVRTTHAVNKSQLLHL